MTMMPLHPAFVEPPVQEELDKRNDGPAPRSRSCVLVVEDEGDFRTSITEALERDGFAVAAVGSAADARERLQAFAYDGLVVDLRLPDADGMDVLTEALERYPQMSAIVITGFGGVGDAVQAMKRGAIDFLLKQMSRSRNNREFFQQMVNG